MGRVAWAVPSGVLRSSSSRGLHGGLGLQHTEGPDKGSPLSAPDSITATVSDHDGVAVLSIGGEIDLVTAPALEEAIGGVITDNPQALIIDLSGVEFLGSVGLKILAATYEKLGDSAEFGVVARGPATRRPIHLTGLDKTFPLYPTLDDALTGVRDGKLNR